MCLLTLRSLSEGDKQTTTDREMRQTRQELRMKISFELWRALSCVPHLTADASMRRRRRCCPDG